MKKRNLKGFTLIELIIVMAIFSLLMVGAMSLVDPVSRIHSRANTGENSYAYVDNIQNYLQDSLEYADHLWVVQGNLSDDDLAEKARDFKNTYYQDVITKKDSDTSPDFGNCRIRVMTILNKDSDSFVKGQILMQTVDYKSNADIDVTPVKLSDAVPQINDAALQDTYLYDYIIGASTLIKQGEDHLVPDTLMGGNPSVDVPDSLTPSNMAITIVAYKNKKDKNGLVTENLEVADGEGTIDINSYPIATHYTVANIPLFNIIQRDGHSNQSYWVQGTDADGHETWATAKKKEVNAGPFSASKEDISMKKDDNIYIIYAMADEIATPDL